MRLKNIFLATTLLALAACGSAGEEAPKADADEVEAPAAETPATQDPAAPGKPKTEAEIKRELAAFQDSVEKAMSDIPPELRDKFQQAFSCEIEKNSKLAEPKEINAATIRSITARLESGGAVC